ncbi:MAG: prepilin-type N-terminal cleavage/methylation domain-containing protein [Bacteriovoracaceae bacterium]|jgi:prepilin-type N-terminal cleavage/methylation domain-containing protein|nr:prepilin-type N-terminal cleavage/methylation domain-containing protein [Bacteriovoracaceae bacterium]
MNIFNNQKGFSFVEIMISMGILGMVAFASLSLIDMETKTVKHIDKGSDTLSFLSGIGKYISSGPGCSELAGSNLTGAWQAFTINNYDGYGGNDGNAGTAQAIGAGFEISKDYAELTSMHFRRKPGAISIDKFIQGTAKRERIIQIRLRVRTAKRSAKIAAGDTVNREYFFELPVLTSVGNVIESCTVGMSVDEVCSALQLVHDPLTGVCIANGGSSCIYRGTYIQVTCAPGGYACTPSFPYPGGGPIRDNPFTGGQSCPANSVGVRTGTFSSSRSVSCGKKCSVTVTTTENYFTCLDCPP